MSAGVNTPHRRFRGGTTRLLKWVFVLTGLLSCIGFAHAQSTYPARPIRLVVPVAPGGAVDVVGRITAQKLGSYLGHNVVVDNRPGANYIIGTEVVSKAPADGYTLIASWRTTRQRTLRRWH